jgi:hypothetical protein
MRAVLKQFSPMIVCCAFLGAQTAAPERTIQNNVVSSERDPQVRVRLPKSAQYVGGDRWVLYDMADCELHAFVEADPQKTVQRLYWVQFEAYVPTRPELKHTYDSPRHATLGGMDFFVDTWVRAKNEPMKQGSDLEHIVDLAGRRGYRMPDGMMYVRLVYLFHEKRKELMVIYAEDVAHSGFTVEELKPGGTANRHWPALEKGLIERAEKSIGIEPIGP